MLFERVNFLHRLHDRASSLGLALLVLSPLVFLRSLEDAYVLPQRLVALLGLGLAFLALGRVPLNRSTLFLGALAYFLWRAICQALTAQAGEAWPWAVTQLPSVGALILAAHAGRDGAWARRAWRWGALSAILAAAYALVLLWGWDPGEAGAVDFGFLQRAHGSLGNPDFLAGFLVLAVPGMALGWLTTERPQAWRLGALGLVLVTLLLTHVRAAWLAAGIALVVSLVAAWSRVEGRRLALLVGLGLALLAAFSVPSRLNAPGQSPWERLRGTFSGDGSWAGRRFMATVALNLAKEHPLTGTGASRFQDAYLVEQGRLLGQPAHAKEPYRFTADIHNDWLQNAAESGWMGLALLLAVFALAARSAWAWREGQGAAFLGLLAAFGVQALFHFPLGIQASALFFWGSIGLLAARAEESAGETGRWNLSWLTWPLAFGFALTFQQAFASAVLNTATVFKDRGDPGIAESFFGVAAHNWPQDVRAWMRLGIVQDAQGNGEAAIDSFIRATEISPGLPEAWSNLALALGKSGDLKSAQAAAEQALSLNPRAVEAWANLAKIRSLQDDLAGAQRDLEAGLAQAGPSPLLENSLRMVKAARQPKRPGNAR